MCFQIVKRKYPGTAIAQKVRFALVHKEISVQLEIIISAVKVQKKQFLETSLNFLMEHWPVPKKIPKSRLISERYAVLLGVNPPCADSLLRQ